ncbi:MAG: type II toxin-antitoxin system RelE/ParE family toxin [Spirochaetales bacterium]|nr:type II toxin-antitoxin system RelE/ParE family toxin [Spirochaetales bacterium]
MAEVKIIWSDKALSDIEEIIAYISKDSEYFAINSASKIISTVELLKSFPDIGRIVPEYQNTEIRELIYRNYRIVYKYKTKFVGIITVFHGSKLLK